MPPHTLDHEANTEAISLREKTLYSPNLFAKKTWMQPTPFLCFIGFCFKTISSTKMFTCAEYWIIVIYSFFSWGNSLNKNLLELMNWLIHWGGRSSWFGGSYRAIYASWFWCELTHLSESTLEKPRDKSRALSKSFSLSTLLLIQTIKAAVLRSLFYIRCAVLQLRD